MGKVGRYINVVNEYVVNICALGKNIAALTHRAPSDPDCLYLYAFPGW